MAATDKPTLDEQAAADPQDFEEKCGESSGLYNPAPGAGTVIVAGKVVSVQ
jgi:hypothetical protein